MLDSKIPEGPLAEKWTRYKSSVPLVSPANKLKLEIIVVGTGLAGASAAASLGEMGYKVKVFCFQDSPREPIQSQPKVELMQQKITKMMEILFIDSFMILLKGVIIDLERQTSID